MIGRSGYFRSQIGIVKRCAIHWRSRTGEAFAGITDKLQRGGVECKRNLLSQTSAPQPPIPPIGKADMQPSILDELIAMFNIRGRK
jgi:hypothetical protein